MGIKETRCEDELELAGSGEESVVGCCVIPLGGVEFVD